MTKLIDCMVTRRAPFRHVLDRHGLWSVVRRTPPRDEFGPLVNLGLIRVACFWNENRRVRAFVRSATRGELATFICLLAAMGEDWLGLTPPE